MSDCGNLLLTLGSATCQTYNNAEKEGTILLRLERQLGFLEMPSVERETYNLNLAKHWVNAVDFDAFLKRAGDPRKAGISAVAVSVATGTGIMVDAALRLLSLCNQLVVEGKSVSISFEDDISGSMGYLDRIAFFDLLDARVDIYPDLPEESAAELYAGNNSGLIEIQAISRVRRDDTVPTRLAKRLSETRRTKAERTAIYGAAYSMFGELIGNIHAHSETFVDGYAVYQQYSGGNQVTVAVSDSGVGLIETLRPTLLERRLRNMNDADLVVEMFRRGVSRFGVNGGSGLPAAAGHAIRYGAELNVRLARSSVRLEPRQSGYHIAHCTSDLPAMRGTHVSFKFRLDK